jgi:hypothetical protein
MSKELLEVLDKEIDLIQSCISRMAQHSFYLKGWLITIIGIVITLRKDSIIITALLLLGIIVVFWYLNAIYLRYEKQYRELYNWVIKERLKANYEYLYDLNLHRFDKKVANRFILMFRNTLLVFYGSLFIVILAIIIVKIVGYYI